MPGLSVALAFACALNLLRLGAYWNGSPIPPAAWHACNPAMVPLGLKVMMTASGPLAHVTGTCSRSNRPFRANVGAPWLRYSPIASWQAAHPFRGGAARAAFIIAGSNLPSTAVNFPAARSAATWSARTANEAGGVGELPATLLLLLPQAGKKHTTAALCARPNGH